MSPLNTLHCTVLLLCTGCTVMLVNPVMKPQVQQQAVVTRLLHLQAVVTRQLLLRLLLPLSKPLKLSSTSR
jgi:hypothetical protein